MQWQTIDSIDAFDALFLDAGNTVLFLDMQAVRDVAQSCGVNVDADTLQRVEGQAKREYERVMAMQAGHASGWDVYMLTLLQCAGASANQASDCLVALHAEHKRFNLWRKLPNDLMPALRRLRASGKKLGIISNAEGTLAEHFERLNIAGDFDLIVDSTREGVHKPDPEIFLRALSRLGVHPSRAIYAGDIVSVDIYGAQRVGMHAVLIDPFGFYADEHVPAPKLRSVRELVDALLPS